MNPSALVAMWTMIFRFYVMAGVTLAETQPYQERRASREGSQRLACLDDEGWRHSLRYIGPFSLSRETRSATKDGCRTNGSALQRTRLCWAQARTRFNSN